MKMVSLGHSHRRASAASMFIVFPFAAHRDGGALGGRWQEGGLWDMFAEVIADVSWLYVGNRSSVDETRSDGPEDETTVVEPDQGNGEISSHAEGDRGDVLTRRASSLTHHLAAATWCGFESSGVAHLHSGA